MKQFLLIFSLFFGLSNALAQLQADWLMEAQRGQLPGEDDKPQNALYGDFAVQFHHRGWRAAAALQAFGTSVEGAGYQQLHQRYLAYSSGALQFQAGHFFTTLGRGLVLQAYQLPNVIQEQRSFRRRYAFYRDLDGFLAEGRWERFEFTALAAKPLRSEFPPRLQNLERRTDPLYGGQVRVRPWRPVVLGDAFLLQQQAGQPSRIINSLFTELQATSWLQQAGLEDVRSSLYVEHAAIQASPATFWGGKEGIPRATYAALNLSNRFAGLSLEYKSYDQFETGLNVPPLAYKEHTYYLLNRSTHELLADAEEGFQAEISLRPARNWWISLNHSSAENDLGYRSFAFRDQLIEARWDLHPDWIARGFYDWAKDELRGESGRYTGGAGLDWSINGRDALTLDVQMQRVHRSFAAETERHENQFASLTFSRAPGLSWSAAVERSTDPEAIDDPSTPYILETNPQYWLQTVLSIRVMDGHELSLFWGKRRGGLACLSGTCYEVLPYEGLEIRWTGHL